MGTQSPINSPRLRWRCRAPLARMATMSSAASTPAAPRSLEAIRSARRFRRRSPLGGRRFSEQRRRRPCGHRREPSFRQQRRGRRRRCGSMATLSRRAFPRPPKPSTRMANSVAAQLAGASAVMGGAVAAYADEVCRPRQRKRSANRRRDPRPGRVVADQLAQASEATRSAVAAFTDEVVARATPAAHRLSTRSAPGRSDCDQLPRPRVGRATLSASTRTNRRSGQCKRRTGRRGDPLPWRPVADRLSRPRGRRAAPSRNMRTRSSLGSARAANRPSRRSASMATSSPVGSPRPRRRRAAPSREYADEVVARVSASGEQAAEAIRFHGDSHRRRLSETSGGNAQRRR